MCGIWLVGDYGSLLVTATIANYKPPNPGVAITLQEKKMTRSIAPSARLQRLVPAILIATAAFGAVAGVSMEAAGVASARPNQCADGQCPPPHPPNESTHPAGSSPYIPPQPPQPPAPTQDFACDAPGYPCVTIWHPS